MSATSSRLRPAFSLVEVVVAIGIFAIAIVSIIGLLVPIRSSVSEVRDSDDASRLATLIQGELQKQGFATVASVLDITPNASADNIFYATRDATKVGLGNSTVVWGSNTPTFNVDSEKFYRIELFRNTALSPTPAADATSGYLAFTIRLAWPAFAATPPGGTSVLSSPTQQSVLLLPAAITR